MTGIEDWLSEGLGESVAKSEAIVKANEPKGTPKVTQAQPAVGGDPLPLTPAAGARGPETKSLALRGIGLGGIIRNPTTVRRTAERVGNASNVTTLKLNAQSNVKSVAPPTPEEDARAENPALAFKPLVRMDDDKQPVEPVDVHCAQESARSLSGQSAAQLKNLTIGQLLEYAKANGGIFHIAVRGVWVLSVELNRN